MRNKVLFEKKFDQMERMLTAIEYCISRGEQGEGLQEVQRTKELLENYVYSSRERTSRRKVLRNGQKTTYTRTDI